LGCLFKHLRLAYPLFTLLSNIKIEIANIEAEISTESMLMENQNIVLTNRNMPVSPGPIARQNQPLLLPQTLTDLKALETDFLKYSEILKSAIDLMSNYFKEGSDSYFLMFELLELIEEHTQDPYYIFQIKPYISKLNKQIFGCMLSHLAEIPASKIPEMTQPTKNFSEEKPASVRLREKLQRLMRQRSEKLNAEPQQNQQWSILADFKLLDAYNTIILKNFHPSFRQDLSLTPSTAIGYFSPTQSNKHSRSNSPHPPLAMASGAGFEKPQTPPHCSLSSPKHPMTTPRIFLQTPQTSLIASPAKRINSLSAQKPTVPVKGFLDDSQNNIAKLWKDEILAMYKQIILPDQSRFLLHILFSARENLGIILFGSLKKILAKKGLYISAIEPGLTDNEYLSFSKHDNKSMLIQVSATIIEIYNAKEKRLYGGLRYIYTCEYIINVRSLTVSEACINFHNKTETQATLPIIDLINSTIFKTFSNTICLVDAICYQSDRYSPQQKSVSVFQINFPIKILEDLPQLTLHKVTELINKSPELKTTLAPVAEDYPRCLQFFGKPLPSDFANKDFNSRFEYILSNKPSTARLWTTDLQRSLDYITRQGFLEPLYAFETSFLSVLNTQSKFRPSPPRGNIPSITDQSIRTLYNLDYNGTHFVITGRHVIRQLSIAIDPDSHVSDLEPIAAPPEGYFLTFTITITLPNTPEENYQFSEMNLTIANNFKHREELFVEIFNIINKSLNDWEIFCGDKMDLPLSTVMKNYLGKKTIKSIFKSGTKRSLF
jgi:hypothetical protein